MKPKRITGEQNELNKMDIATNNGNSKPNDRNKREPPDITSLEVAIWVGKQAIAKCEQLQAEIKDLKECVLGFDKTIKQLQAQKG